MKFTLFSHQSADALLPDKERREIENALISCNVVVQKGAATQIREEIVQMLDSAGWSGEVQVEPPSKITIASKKNGVGLCIQTGGNMSRMYADILKLQKLYMENSIKTGVFILPASPAARALGQNVANADRLIGELHIFRKVIHMPIAVFAFE